MFYSWSNIGKYTHPDNESKYQSQTMVASEVTMLSEPPKAHALQNTKE